MARELDLSGFPPASLADWRRKVEESLGDERFEDALVSLTDDGIPIQPLYTAESGPTAGPRREIEGEATAGWKLIPSLDDPDPVRAAEALKVDLGRGADGFWLRFNRLDRSGAPLSADAGEGLSIVDTGDLEALLAPVDLAATSLYLEAGAAGPAAAALLLSVARSREVPWTELSGCLGIDPLGTRAAYGSPEGKAGLGSLDRDFQALAAAVDWSHREAPGLRAALVSTDPYHDAGASPVEELAIALATGAETLRRLTASGMEPSAVASELLFSFSVTSDLFGSIAKLRAARRLWAGILRAWEIPSEGHPLVLRARGSWRSRTLYQRPVNVLRGTVETFAAAVGGADLITTLRYDEALAPGRELSRRMATHTQHILRLESHIDRVRDAAGGSWFVERLTEELCRRAWALFQDFEAGGGMAAILASGRLSRRLEDTALRRRRRVAYRRAPLTGVSEYPNLAEPPPEDPGDRQPAIDAYLRRRRAAKAAEASAGAFPEEWVAQAAAGASLPALAGSAREAPPRAGGLPSRRNAEDFEELRQRSDAFLEAHDRRPQVFVLCFSPPRQIRPRISFVRNLLAAGGIEARIREELEDEAASAEAFAESGLGAVILCGTDEDIPRLVPSLTDALRLKGARRVIVAGHPGDLEVELRRSGVDTFIFHGCDVAGFLERLYRDLEARDSEVAATEGDA